jgi:predicted RNase H-like HicB family nuclease
LAEGLSVKHYIALIHKDPDSAYGVSFPDVPGVVASAASLDAALEEARRALAFAVEDWGELSGAAFPAPRSLDALRNDSRLREDFADAVVAAIPLQTTLNEAA